MFAWNAFILTKQTITSCSITEKFPRRKCLSWRCDVTIGLPLRGLSFALPVCRRRIISLRHLNHMQSSIVLSTKVNNLPFWKFECSQERRCHGSVKMTVSDRWVWFRLEWLTRQLQTTLMCLARSPDSRCLLWTIWPKFGRSLDQVFYGSVLSRYHTVPEVNKA
jgi:hypothetical protein